MNKKIIVGTLMGCLFGATVGYSASVVTLPHTFTAGTAIKASEVNANFSALAQEISALKNISSDSIESSDYSLINVVSENTSVGSVVTSGAKSYEIKKITDITDLITAKKYTLTYPSLQGSAGGDILQMFSVNCNELLSSHLIVKKAVFGKFDTGLYFRSLYLGGGSQTGMSTDFGVQVSKNTCVALRLDNSTTNDALIARQMINDSAALFKYVSVIEQ